MSTDIQAPAERRSVQLTSCLHEFATSTTGIRLVICQDELMPFTPFREIEDIAERCAQVLWEHLPDLRDDDDF